MAKPLLPDDLWELIEPLLPEHEPSPLGGRPRLDDRKCLTGILFVLKTGIAWEDLPVEMGCGSGMTCWRRLDEWQQAGVWGRLHQLLLEKLEQAGKIDWSRAAVDSAKSRAIGGGEGTGPNPTDRAKPGAKHHVLTDGEGTPLNQSSTGANRHDVTELLPLLDEMPEVGGKEQRPQRLDADRAYDSEEHREELRARGVEPELAERGEAHGSGLGVYRWVSERTLGWLHNFKRLRTRYDWTDRIHEAFLNLASCIICWRRLRT